MANSDEWVIFKYEVDMFRATLSLCNNGSKEFFAQAVQNALVESLLLHARILVDILLSRSPGSDDVTLFQLLPNFTSPDLYELKTLYRSWRDPGSPCWILNKMLAHPSSLRSDHYDYSAPMQRLAPCIMKLIAQIEEHIPGATACPGVAADERKETVP